MPVDASQPDADVGSALVLRPFRATRYGPAVGGDIGTVTSPPYDVIDEQTVDRLFDSHPCNVVRLILPRRFSGAPDYDGVAHLLQQWRTQQVLVEDDTAALYVYEYTAGRHTVRGLVGALALRDRHTGTVLPHEEVMPGPVRDRAELIARTGTNLEPILLVYDGNGPASDLVDAATAEAPLFSTTAPDGSTHTVWPITATDPLRTIAADLAPRRALIADGHHRYAAYQQVQRERPGDEFGRGLAMLVDQQRYPLQLGPIHRVLEEAVLDDVNRRGPADVTVHDLGVDGEAARREVTQAPDGRAAFACTDGSRWLVVSGPRAAGEVDTHLLHERLLPAWGTADANVRYVHDADHAVQEARDHGGVAVLVRPPSVGTVVAAAELGRSLPRKSTSFGPKPRMGLLMRSLHPAPD